MTDFEVEVEAYLRATLPDGDVRDYGRRDRELLSLAGQWSEALEMFGAPDESSATLGILRDLVRFDLNSPQAYARPTASGWLVYRTSFDRVAVTDIAPTEAEAWLAALSARVAGCRIEIVATVGGVRQTTLDIKGLTVEERDALMYQLRAVLDNGGEQVQPGGFEQWWREWWEEDGRAAYYEVNPEKLVTDARRVCLHFYSLALDTVGERTRG